MLKKIKKYKKFIDNNFKWQREICRNDLKLHPASTTVHHQAFDVKIDWIDNFAKRKFSLYTISVLKQMPNMLIPLHKDKYYYFRKKFNISKNQNIFRVQIFLQDWMPGHYFEIEKKPIVKWHAGHYILLDKTMDHRSANVGKVPKYTAQVTGILK